ncbi:E3 ubiquitin-protein ligase RHF1A-like isoform X1 [Camellia sinensis]|uniref:E3 ubiquitin-protein ligase RHF1A-like isoform X1 n=1 Tax=Camellia sinensis TaxID=4442 RepID=UPI001036EFDB|nr:E3 ubiquitin-protein ligase RHF1A-like isoform X1 [Camellia sinensis]
MISAASSSGATVADHDDDLENACSIYLEPFNSQDPLTVTNCRHEYHLQCILEWSQRSKECPICWQLLVLKDPSSQELLAAVEIERNLRSRRNARHIHEDYEMNIANSYGDDSDFDERIMRHFAAAARRAHYVERRGRPRSSGIGPPLVLLSVPTGDLPLPDVQHLRTTSPEERQTSSYEFSEGDSPTFSTLRSVVPVVVNVEPNSVGNRDLPELLILVFCSKSPQRPSSSEFLAFSESVKLKFSTASARYKESISKSTRGFKEKLLAHNISARELGRGVQREMNAGIAGVARMIERLDLPSKRTGISIPLSSCSTSNFSYKGKDTQESVITQSPNENAGESVHDMSSPESPRGHSTFPSELDISLVQSGR